MWIGIQTHNSPFLSSICNLFTFRCLYFIFFWENKSFKQNSQKLSVLSLSFCLSASDSLTHSLFLTFALSPSCLHSPPLSPLSPFYSSLSLFFPTLSFFPSPLSLTSLTLPLRPLSSPLSLSLFHPSHVKLTCGVTLFANTGGKSFYLPFFFYQNGFFFSKKQKNIIFF